MNDVVVGATCILDRSKILGWEGSRLAKMTDDEEELGTSEHEVEHPPMAGGAGEKGDDEGSRVRRSLMLGSTVCR